MNVTPKMSPSNNLSQLSLNTFKEAVDKSGPDDHIILDGASLRVLATGETPGGHKVAWVEGNDTTQALLHALASAVGEPHQRAIAKTLNLTEGKVLSSGTVRAALDMAKTGLTVFGGIDFVTRSQCSGASMGNMYLNAINALPAQHRAIIEQCTDRLDDRMERHFHDAAASGLSPVSIKTAADWLDAEINAVLKDTGSN